MDNVSKGYRLSEFVLRIFRMKFVFQNSTDVLGVFSSYKLEKSGNDDDESGKGRTIVS